MEHARHRGASERHACHLVHQPRGTQRYQPTQRNDEDALTRAIITLAARYGRYGYRRITIMECPAQFVPVEMRQTGTDVPSGPFKLRYTNYPTSTNESGRPLVQSRIRLSRGMYLVFVPILYRRAGRRGIFGFLNVVFSVSYRTERPVERTIPSLATVGQRFRTLTATLDRPFD